MTGVSTNFRVSFRHRPDATVPLEIKHGIRIPRIPFTLRISDAALIKFNIAPEMGFFFSRVTLSRKRKIKQEKGKEKLGFLVSQSTRPNNGTEHCTNSGE